MEFQYTPEQEAYRQQFVSWLDENLPEDTNVGTDVEGCQKYKDFQRRLFDAGYAGVHYPKEYGGQGQSLIEEVIVTQVLAERCVLLRFPGIITHGMAMPVIYNCGTEEQKKTFMPKILEGTHIWCQGFSEPDAGSDVVNVNTRAVKEGDHYVVNGQKVWTTVAHASDYCLLLVNTDPSGPKHKSLSYLLVDMRLPGVEARPMPQITREPEFNEVFFDNVKVPADMLVAKEGQGWMIAITTLMFERTLGDVTTGTAYCSNFESMLEMAGQAMRSGKPALEDPIYRQQLGQAYIEIMTLKYHGLRNLSRQLGGDIPGPEGSVGKLLWSLPNQKLTEAAIGMLGSAGQIFGSTPWSIQDDRWQYSYLRSFGNTIEAGTTEIQRNIIGERVLGLPKDMSRTSRV
ncbi:MAG: acyl-CoA dehydrogenase family protein [Deltaproteobacteria bacterium]|nr:acyl-CoA dehydrogenase family protein [Deltaproteobacteria bacterium]